MGHSTRVIGRGLVVVRAGDQRTQARLCYTVFPGLLIFDKATTVITQIGV